MRVLALQNRYFEVGPAWANSVLPLIKNTCQGIANGYDVHTAEFEWVYYDAYGKVLLGKAKADLGERYYTKLTAQELTLFQQGQHEVALVKKLGTGKVPEEQLRMMQQPIQS